MESATITLFTHHQSLPNFVDWIFTNPTIIIFKSITIIMFVLQVRLVGVGLHSTVINGRMISGKTL